jgi:hypothetical protein
MNKNEFTAAAIAAVGTAIEWQSKIAKNLGVNERTIRRWLSGEKPIPDWVDEKLKSVVNFDKNPFFSFDEWIVGEAAAARDGKRRRYILHAHFPRFLARIVYYGADNAPDPQDCPVSDGGTSYQIAVYDDGDYERFEEIVFYDPANAGEITALLEKAADVWEAENDHE